MSVPTDSTLSDFGFLASVVDLALEALLAVFAFPSSSSVIKSSSPSEISSKTSSFFLANFLTAAAGFFATGAVAEISFGANSSKVSGKELKISSSESESSITNAAFLFPDDFLGELELD